MSTETALELDVEAAGDSRGAEVHFSNFPGLWQPGRPVAAAELGFDSVDDALAAAKELGLPLREVSVEAGSAPMPVRDNHVANEEQQRALELARERDWPPRTHADADSAAATTGVEWPHAKMTLPEKVAFLDSYTTGTADQTGADTTGDGDA